MTTALPTQSALPSRTTPVAVARRDSAAMPRRVTARRRLPTTHVVAAPLALVMAAFPSYLPRQPIALGLLLGIAWLSAHALVGGLARRARLRSPHAHGWPEQTRRLARAAGMLFAIAAFTAAVAVQDAMRARIGMASLGPTDLVTTAVAAASVLVVVGGVRAIWRRRAHWWRPALALGLAVSLTGAAQPADATPSSAATPQEQVLLQRSEAGAARAYASLVDEPDLERRADLAAARLVRDGGLGRRHVVIAVPTGSGWINPRLVRGLEQRFGREVATVAMQYDDRPSWLSYLLGKADAEEGARALFRAVHRRVAELPRADRPQLHVAGESLGATAGQSIFTGPDATAARETVCSTLWVGTPGGDGVGAPREVMVTNADDPIVHARPSMLLVPPRDGRPWLPIVSGVQAAADFVGALAVPTGSGHRYGTEQARRLRTC